MTDSATSWLSSLFNAAPTDAAATAAPAADFGPQNIDGGGLGAGGNAPTTAAASLGPSVDTSALAGLGDTTTGGYNIGGSAGERGLGGAGGAASAVSQYNAPATGVAGAGAGASPTSSVAPASVSPFGGGAGAGNFALSTDGGAGPSSVTGTSNYNTGGVVGNLGTDAAKTPSWGDAAKGFLKDYGSLIGPAVSGGGLLASLVRGNQPMPGENAIKAEASQLASQGQTLQNYLTSGTLPPGVAASLHTAGESAKAAIRSQYAARGMSGSDAEARDLANVDTSIVTQGASIASNLLSQGVQESQLSAQLYSTIMNAATQQDAQLGQAISSFASSLVPRQNIVVAGQGTP